MRLNKKYTVAVAILIRQRYREADTQTERQADRQADRQTDVERQI